MIRLLTQEQICLLNISSMFTLEFIVERHNKQFYFICDHQLDRRWSDLVSLVLCDGDHHAVSIIHIIHSILTSIVKLTPLNARSILIAEVEG